ncbi:MAG: IclR family transcriptional regulator [Pararhodobacter sp.]|nr:IclR family transcriptional regulator [Pararhodobacter sp.]
MAAQKGPLSLSEIGRACSMPPSKVHRYLASFVGAGLVKQQGRSGRYDLGPAALQLGLAALARHSFVNAAADGLSDLSGETGMTALLSVWANQGATVVRWERGITPTDMSMGLGTTLPLLNSATGRVFLAWGAPRAVAPVRDAQFEQFARRSGQSVDPDHTSTSIAAIVESIRADGYASVVGRYIPGLVAIAAPVLDWQGEAQAAITLVGIDPPVIAPDSPQVQCLLAYCAEKSVVRASD